MQASTNGGSRGNPGRGGHGIVYRTDAGAVQAVVVKHIGVSTAYMAECYSILNAAVKAIEKGWTKLYVVSD
ncbi:hypothetical protein GIB67_035075 [Kingdonia uniflora]|uniref:RNase H type-1 domain-containing protein n=1 Tax=Kingdonia uniflora TaxID=39325 RepID=A0A7J7L1L1_9MAGN|nr:hypothetical protein GIB67_035075 [Kingdonia uniflora]